MMILRHTIMCAVVLLASSPQHACAQVPGDLREVTFAVKDRPSPSLILRFRYCPPGYLARIKAEVDPATTDALTTYAVEPVEMSGFWMAESELSQDDYETIRILAQSLPDNLRPDLPDIDELLGRGGKWRHPGMRDPVTKQMPSRFDDSFKDGAKPVFGLTATDCANICMILHEIQGDTATNRSNSTSTFVASTFRMPSFEEWQYACRGLASDSDPQLTSQQVQERRHFVSWPEAPLRAFNELKTANGPDVSVMNTDDKFQASQDQIITILHSNDRKDDIHKLALYVLYKFLHGTAGFNSQFGLDFAGRQITDLKVQDRYNSTYLSPAVSSYGGEAHPWKLQQMHGNVFEWCLDSTSPQVSWQSFVRLQGGRIANRNSGTDFAFRLAGGWFLHTSYEQFTIWGASRLSHGEATNASRMELQMPGLRLALVEEYSSAWIHLVRNAARDASNGQLNAAEATNKIRDVQQRLLRKFRGTRRESTEAFLTFYVGVVQNSANSANSSALVEAFEAYRDSLAIVQQSDDAEASSAYFRELAVLEKP